jgi:hypothetical protein
MKAQGKVRTGVAAIALAVAAIGGTLVVTAGPASAAIPEATCTATVLKALGGKGAPANVGANPCVAETNIQLPISVPLSPLINVFTGSASSVTTEFPELGGVSAETAIANSKISVLGINILLGPITSVASAEPVTCTTIGESHIAYLKINNQLVTNGIYGPLTINLVVGKLHLNQQVVVNGTLTQRAVFLDLPGTALDITIAEATAGIDSCA